MRRFCSFSIWIAQRGDWVDHVSAAYATLSELYHLCIYYKRVEASASASRVFFEWLHQHSVRTIRRITHVDVIDDPQRQVILAFCQFEAIWYKRKERTRGPMLERESR